MIKILYSHCFSWNSTKHGPEVAHGVDIERHLLQSNGDEIVYVAGCLSNTRSSMLNLNVKRINVFLRDVVRYNMFLKYTRVFICLGQGLPELNLSILPFDQLFAELSSSIRLVQVGATPGSQHFGSKSQRTI